MNLLQLKAAMFCVCGCLVNHASGLPCADSSPCAEADETSDASASLLQIQSNISITRTNDEICAWCASMRVEKAGGCQKVLNNPALLTTKCVGKTPLFGPVRGQTCNGNDMQQYLTARCDQDHHTYSEIVNGGRQCGSLTDPGCSMDSTCQPDSGVPDFRGTWQKGKLTQRIEQCGQSIVITGANPGNIDGRYAIHSILVADGTYMNGGDDVAGNPLPQCVRLLLKGSYGTYTDSSGITHNDCFLFGACNIQGCEDVIAVRCLESSGDKFKFWHPQIPNGGYETLTKISDLQCS